MNIQEALNIADSGDRTDNDPLVILAAEVRRLSTPAPQGQAVEALKRLADDFKHKESEIPCELRIELCTRLGAIERLLTPPAAPAGEATDTQWQNISTAPKYGWFLALRSPFYDGPTKAKVAVIHRVEGVGFGPWEGAEEAYYKADFFTHWMPLPESPAAMQSAHPTAKKEGR